jgi:hypothetical protein
MAGHWNRVHLNECWVSLIKGHVWVILCLNWLTGRDIGMMNILNKIWASVIEHREWVIKCFHCSNALESRPFDEIPSIMNGWSLINDLTLSLFEILVIGVVCIWFYSEWGWLRIVDEWFEACMVWLVWSLKLCIFNLILVNFDKPLWVSVLLFKFVDRFCPWNRGYLIGLVELRDRTTRLAGGRTLRLAAGWQPSAGSRVTKFDSPRGRGIRPASGFRHSTHSVSREAGRPGNGSTRLGRERGTRLEAGGQKSSRRVMTALDWQRRHRIGASAGREAWSSRGDQNSPTRRFTFWLKFVDEWFVVYIFRGQVIGIIHI